MTPSKLFSIVRARWHLVLAIIVLTTLTALLVSLSLQKKYIATASIVIDAKPDPVSALIYPGMASPAFINTQIDVINSDRVALRVVRDLKLASVPEIHQQWLDQGGEGDVEQWLIPTLQANMDVKPSKESNVLQVTYKSPDPKFAALLANAFVKAYLAVNLELRVEPARQYAGYFDEQAKLARDKLEQAKNKLSSYERENGILATDERMDVETNRLNELSSQLVAVQGQSTESGSRLAQAAGQRSDRLAEVLNNPLIVQLKADLGRAVTRLEELGTRYGDNHPQVVEAKTTVAELRQRLQNETARVTGGVAVSNSINRQREAEIRAALEAQREKVLHLKTARDEAGVLLREVENAQRAYETVNTRLSQTNLESQATQGNVNILTSAVPPMQPASPNVRRNTALAFVVGTMLALGLAFLLELRDRKVRDADDVLTLLQLPMLGVLPAPAKRSPTPPRRLGSLQQRLLNERPSGKGAV